MSAPAPQWATFTAIATRQIDLFCMPLQMNTDKPLADFNQAATRSPGWPRSVMCLAACKDRS